MPVITGAVLGIDLLFTDNTYDIGKSGATRPRDGFFSRKLAASVQMDAGAYTLNGLTPADGWYLAQNTKGLLVQNSAGANKVGLQLDGSNVWQLGDGLPVNLTSAITATTLTTSAPTGGAGTWKLGIANAVSPTAPNRTITVDIGGTVYYIHAKTTNN